MISDTIKIKTIKIGLVERVHVLFHKIKSGPPNRIFIIEISIGLNFDDRLL